MESPRQEIISIKRSPQSLDGKVICYLKSNPLKLGFGFAEVVISTLKMHWLPLTLFSLGVRGEELRQTAIWAVKQLEAQAEIIRGVCGLESDTITLDKFSQNSMPTDFTSEPKPSLQKEELSSSWENDDDNDDDDDDDFLDLELTEEMAKNLKRFSGG